MSQFSRMYEVSRRIDAHLKRFEADPEINAKSEFNRTPRYFMAQCVYGQRMRRPRLSYVNYQHEYRLLPAEAERYLAWLDAGNVGKHTGIPKDWDPELANVGQKSVKA